MLLDLLFLVDISGSMEESAGAQSKWVALRGALETFFGDPKSEGLGVGLTFFPPPARRCTLDEECGAAVDPALDPAAPPRRVLLCPGSCDKAKNRAGVSIQLRFGCKTRVD